MRWQPARLSNDSGERPSLGPSLIWAAPGSVYVSAIESAWTRRPHLHRLRTISGPWAVALASPTGDLILACDPVGVQPCYWTRTRSGDIAATSWLAALVDLPEVDDTLDPEGLLLDQGCWLQDPRMHHRTAFRFVSRVPGGHALRIRPDGSTVLERYWDPRDLPGPDESLTLADCADLLRESVDGALREALDGEGPFGSHVSGGLDSSALACRAQALLRDRGDGLVAGIAWSPDEQQVPRMPGDERPLLDDIAAQCSLPVRRVRPSDDDGWFWELNPARYPDSTHFREAAALPVARRLGVRTLISGWGGDELASFNGRGVFQSLVRGLHLRTAWRESQLRLSTLREAPPARRERARAFAGLAWGSLPGGVRSLRAPGETRRERAQARQVADALRELSPLAAEIWIDQVRLGSSVRPHDEVQLDMLANGYLQHRTAAWYQSGRLMGVGYRFPLLDLAVVEAALRLPWWAYRSAGWDRVAFRLAVAPWVPETVAWNTTKDEPALLGSIIRSSSDWLPRRRGGFADDGARRAWDLIDQTWAATAVPDYVPNAVRARPDRAPRLR